MLGLRGQQLACLLALLGALSLLSCAVGMGREEQNETDRRKGSALTLPGFPVQAAHRPDVTPTAHG